MRVYRKTQHTRNHAFYPTYFCLNDADGIPRGIRCHEGDGLDTPLNRPGIA